jgi:predicted PhzF superfamily epimerase YddE/YHI9
MALPIACVDAFTDAPFRGNPAAVCLLDAPAPDAWMRHVAAELNLSETAFLLPVAEGFHLRWFTPAVEVDLCGHATLAAAHFLWESGRLDGGEDAIFSTRSGRLTARRGDAGIAMDFPATPAAAAAAPPELPAALGGVRPRWSGRSRFDWLLLLDDEAAVGAVAPDFAALARVDARGIIVTAPADAATAGRPAADFISRFFAPAVGVPEDPVTGSAHCCLAPFWAERLGRAELTGWQASARGGTVGVRHTGDRVELTGRAVTTWRGELVG